MGPSNVCSLNSLRHALVDVNPFMPAIRVALSAHTVPINSAIMMLCAS